MNTDRSGHDEIDHEEEELLRQEAEIPVTDEALSDSSAPTAREANKRQRRLDARTWAPRESVAVHFHEIQIGSQTLKRAWNPIFVRAQTTLYMLQGVLPSTGELQATQGVEQLTDERMGKLEVELDAELQRLYTLARNDGMETPRVATWTDAEQIKVPIYTPTANRYMRLILKVDQLYWTLEYLWFQGTIKTTYKWQVINTWKKKLWDFVKFTTQTWIRARKSLQTKQHDVNQKRQQRIAGAPAANDSTTPNEPAIAAG